MVYKVRIIYTCLMRDEEGKKKEESKVIQTTRQSNTAHPRQSLFQRKNELPRVGFEPTTLHTLDRVLYQLSYLARYIAELAEPKFYIS